MEPIRLNDALIKQLQRITWYLMIASLPLTSMPLIKKILGSDSVASPAIILLMIFVFLWAAGIVFKERISVSGAIVPLALFCCVALAATLISFFNQPPLFKEFRQVNPIFSAVSTLGIGFLFFLIASSFPIDPEIKKKTLNIINWSGLIILFWCGIQAAAWYGTHHYPQWMFNIQGALSARVLYRQRATGFALEPSWLAHQLNMLYLPFWISATASGYSSHSFRFGKISFENILLAGGILVLGLTLSRVGFLAFLCMAAFASIRIHPKLVTALQIWLSKRNKTGRKPNRKQVSTGLFLFYIFMTGLFVFIYYILDPRMATLFKFSLDQDNPILRYFNQLKFGDRVVYWLAGWNIFNRYPLLGVGLGNAGFYFPQNIPAYGWSLIEVRKLLYREHLLLNIKSLWFRLLAETGITGFSLFIGWIISLISNLVEKYQYADPIDRVMGFMGLLVILGMIFEGLSIDSFAMPYWWISLGLAVSSIKKQTELNPKII
jgi:hypothetical protein